MIRDAIEVWKNDSFKQFFDSIESINLVERSGSLRETQCDTLDATKNENSYGMGGDSCKGGDDILGERAKRRERALLLSCACKANLLLLLFGTLHNPSRALFSPIRG